MNEPNGMRLLYVGIDEAGYGPTLGPLCVAAGAFEVEGWSPGSAAPDLWKLLRAAVCAEGPDALKRGRIAINDSKKLKLANDSKSRHPLVHLERGVLSVLGAMGIDAFADDALFEAIGAALPERAWYSGDSIALPLAMTREQAGILRALLAGAAESSGARPVWLACRVVGEDEFNQRLERWGSKAAVSFASVAELMRRVWDEHGSREDLDEHGPRVVVDRQGGRISYGGVLAAALPGAGIAIVEESETRSRYQVTSKHADGRRMSITFQVEAERRHLPVALASMTAKLVRELAMMRFNRYWSGRIAELKPTAGYATDARRWLTDAAPALTPAERRELVRRA